MPGTTRRPRHAFTRAEDKCARAALVAQPSFELSVSRVDQSAVTFGTCSATLSRSPL